VQPDLSHKSQNCSIFLFLEWLLEQEDFKYMFNGEAERETAGEGEQGQVVAAQPNSESWQTEINNCGRWKRERYAYNYSMDRPAAETLYCIRESLLNLCSLLAP
jgi:hypothetical protein